MSDEVKRKPLVGWMIFEEYADDYSHWDGHIAYPDPTGANLAWQSPIKMIEYSTYDALKAENERLRAMCEKLEGALKFYADRDNWTQVSAQQCSSMVGGDDHDTCTNEKGSKFTGGHRARRALAEYEKLKGDE